MLVLKIVSDKPVCKKRSLFKKRKDVNFIERERVILNGKLFYIAEIPESLLESHDTQRLFNAFKGRIIVADNMKQVIDNSYLFQPYEYYQRAFLSSLISRVKSEDVFDRCVLLKIKTFKKCDEITELVKISKKVIVCAEKYFDFDGIYSYCFEKYGAVIHRVNTVDNNTNQCFFCDLTGCDVPQGISVYYKGIRERLSPDKSYFSANADVELLENLGISREEASAVIYA